MNVTLTVREHDTDAPVVSFRSATATEARTFILCQHVLSVLVGLNLLDTSVNVLERF